jgi:hypothetical protein
LQNPTDESAADGGVKLASPTRGSNAAGAILGFRSGPVLWKSLRH